MSLFQQAAAAIRDLMGEGTSKANPARVASDLDAAHAAQATAMAEGDGVQATVSGSHESGFIASLHDGTLFQSYVVQAENAAEALREAFDRFKDEPRPESPVAALPAPEPVVTPPAGPVVEAPFSSDPGTVDVTRGRVGDENRNLDQEAADRNLNAELAAHRASTTDAPVPPGEPLNPAHDSDVETVAPSELVGDNDEPLPPVSDDYVAPAGNGDSLDDPHGSPVGDVGEHIQPDPAAAPEPHHEG